MLHFVEAVGVLCAICGVLAVLLVMAGRILGNYGTCRITINGGQRILDVPGGQSLLSALAQDRVFVPSACGGRGSCGLCKLEVTRGGGPLLPTEQPHLKPDEIAAGLRLACQVKLREDIDIAIPERFFAIRSFRARVAQIRELTWDIRLVRLELIDPETISFVPGQYVQLQTPVYGKNPDPVYRAYSVASAPGDSHHVDLLIRLVPNGICTTWVFTILKEGDEVQFNGPHGDFRLQASDREMIFIAGGSGMAPFLSILAVMRGERSARKCRYFFGARSKRDLFYLEELEALQKDLPNFAFVPALSEPTPEDAWRGETGLITDVVGRAYQDCSSMEAYLCGSPGMVNACVKVLGQRGLQPDRIFFDKFA